MKYLKFFPFYILSILPFRVLYIISDFAFFVIYHLIKYRRRVVSLNLEKSFPNKTKSEIIKIEKKFYKHFCDVFIETLKFLTISKIEIFRRFKVTNQEIIQEYYFQHKNIIIYAAHFGNWEWFSLLPLYSQHQVTTFYKQLSSNYFDHLFRLIRGRFGVICFKSSSGYKGLVGLEKEKILSMNCIVGDQNPSKKSTKHWVTFLNQETAFLVGADKIGKKLNYPIIFPIFQKHKRGNYEIEFIPIANNPKEVKSSEIIDSYCKILEASIIKSPELWLWSHKRWKRTKPKTE